MKRLISLILICTALSGMAQAQKPTYKIINGKVVMTTAKDTTKTPDKVIQVIDGTKFYQGPKGGIYYLKVSKKTGKAYKCYVKQS